MERSDDADEQLNVYFPDQRFPPGALRMTPAARDAVPHEEMMAALRRHMSGDWGEVDEHDRQENELSLEKGFRFLSVYHTDDDVTFWVLTEADRSQTTVMLPRDY